MTDRSGRSLSTDARALADALDRTRRLTLRLVDTCDDEELRTAFHPDFSPVGWHLGHVAMFEAMWVLERAHGRKVLPEAVRTRFDPRANPKPERHDLPDRFELVTFAEDVRRSTLEALIRDAEVEPADPLREGLYVYHFVLAHEQQHAETIATILRMRKTERRERSAFPLPEPGPAIMRAPIRIHGGPAMIGTDDALAYDNEHGAHLVQVKPFELDGQPATNGDWLEFIASGGYLRRELWTDAGNAWRIASRAAHPSTWEPHPKGFRLRALGGDVPLPLTHPVEGVSFFEAEAYAKFRGGRLPTEVEWEVAARRTRAADPRVGLACGAARTVGQESDLLGNVWEWTSSAFAPYPGFSPHPYEGYSKPYFDGAHRVLRGGSWATQAANVRPTFRNWYPPHWRVMPAGVRIARDA